MVSFTCFLLELFGNPHRGGTFNFTIVQIILPQRLTKPVFLAEQGVVSPSVLGQQLSRLLCEM